MASEKGDFADFDDDDLDIVDGIWDRLGADTVRTPKPDAGPGPSLSTVSPAKVDKDGRINLDAAGTRTFVAGLASRLKAVFGITYRGKPDA